MLLSHLVLLILPGHTSDERVRVLVELVEWRGGPVVHLYSRGTHAYHVT